MDPEIVKRLLDINYQFYQTFAGPFSATRQRLQPGVRQVLDSLRGDEAILDIGCGNGTLWRELQRSGHRGSYTGIDFSPTLLEHARATAASCRQVSSEVSSATFILADLSTDVWQQDLPSEGYDLALAFAVLHHLPSSAMHKNLLTGIHRLLAANGRLCLSVWQFLNSPRLSKRVMDWSAAGIDRRQVEDGDYLLDWRAGGSGLRYLHLFTLAELEDLARACGYRIVQSFFSDGKEGNLGLYQIWEKQPE